MYFMEHWLARREQEPKPSPLSVSASCRMTASSARLAGAGRAEARMFAKFGVQCSRRLASSVLVAALDRRLFGNRLDFPESKDFVANKWHS